MASLADRLKDLTKQQDNFEAKRAQLNAAIEQANRDLIEHKSKLEQISASQAEAKARLESLQRLESEISAVRSSTKTGREGATAERDAAKEELTALKARLETELSADRRRTLAEGLAGIDAENRAREEELETAADALSGREREAADAQQKAADAAKAHQEALTEFKELTKQLDGARAQVARLRAAAKAASDGGRTSEAFVLGNDLEAALQDLDRRLSTDREDALTTRLPELLATSQAAAAASTSASAALAAARAAVDSARSRQQAGLKQRDAAVKTLLAAPAPATPAAPEPPAPGDNPQGETAQPGETGEAGTTP